MHASWTIGSEEDGSAQLMQIAPVSCLILRAMACWRRARAGRASRTQSPVAGAPAVPRSGTALVGGMTEASEQSQRLIRTDGEPGSGTKIRDDLGFLLGAAYRNRTDDLRITRGMVACNTGATCADSTARCTDGALYPGLLPLTVPRGVPRRAPLNQPGT